MKRNNFNTLIREEMKTRFEGAVKEEINSYRKEQEDIVKNFETINQNLKLMRAEIESLRRDNETRCQNISEQFIREKKLLENSFEEQRRVIRTTNSEIRGMVEDFNKTRLQYSTNEVIQNHIDALIGLISSIKIENHQDKEEIKNLIDLKVKDLTGKINEDQRLSYDGVKELSEKVNKVNQVIDDFKISVEGFSREITVMKKGEFIQEKHIENLYTRLERLKKHVGGTL